MKKKFRLRYITDFKEAELFICRSLLKDYDEWICPSEIINGRKAQDIVKDLLKQADENFISKCLKIVIKTKNEGDNSNDIYDMLYELFEEYSK